MASKDDLNVPKTKKENIRVVIGSSPIKDFITFDKNPVSNVLDAKNEEKKNNGINDKKEEKNKIMNKDKKENINNIHIYNGTQENDKIKEIEIKDKSLHDKNKENIINNISTSKSESQNINNKNIDPEIIKNKVDEYFEGQSLDNIKWEITYDINYLDKIFEFIEKECGMINSLKNSFLCQILVYIIMLNNMPNDNKQKIDIKYTYILKDALIIIDKIYNYMLHYDLINLAKDKHAYNVINALINHFCQECIKHIKELPIQYSQFNLNNKGYIIQNISKLKKIYSRLKNNLKELFLDDYGTYVIQNLIFTLNYIRNSGFNMGDNKEMEEILNCAIDNIEDLIKNKKGSYFLQNSINNMPLERDKLIEKILDCKNDEFITLITNSYSNFVIRKIIEVGKREYFDNIFEKVKDNNIYELSKNKYGSYIIQDLVTKADIKQFNIIIEKIKGYENLLSKDKYGNYIIGEIQRKRKKYKNKLFK